MHCPTRGFFILLPPVFGEQSGAADQKRRVEEKISDSPSREIVMFSPGRWPAGGSLDSRIAPTSRSSSLLRSRRFLIPKMAKGTNSQRIDTNNTKAAPAR